MATHVEVLKDKPGQYTPEGVFRVVAHVQNEDPNINGMACMV